MKKFQGKHWLGFLIGLTAGQAVVAIMFEHFLLAELILKWPLLIPFFGGLACMLFYKKLGVKAPKNLTSTFIICLLLSIPAFSPFAWEKINQTEHEKYMSLEIPDFPSSILIEQRYGNGDGFDNEPALLKKFKSSDTIQNVQKFYAERLLNNSWESIDGWEEIGGTIFFTKRTAKHNFGVKIWPLTNNSTRTEYEIVFSVYR